MDKLLLEAALEGLTLQLDRVAGQIAQVQAMMGKRKAGRPKASESASGAVAAPKKPKKRRTMSPEARERIAAAQKKRWAAYRKATK
ncbi:MAG: hypothetical protein ABI972_00030 [Acidobacteriota bacterium]